MRVSVLQENLARGLSIVNRAISTRPSMPVLGNVLISTEDARLKLSATNLEMSITTFVGAKVEIEGSVTIPARTFQEWVNTLPPERVDIELDTRTLTLNVNCGTGTASFKGIDSTEFPNIPEPEEDSGIEVPGAALREMIEQVVFATAKEDNRPILTGALVKIDDSRLTMAAADGFRLAVRTADLDTVADRPVSVVVPAKTLSELSRIIPADETKVYISVPTGRNQIMFHLETVDIVSQIIEGKFPDFEQIIPKARSTATQLYTGQLQRACRSVEIFAREAANTIRMRITPGERNNAPGMITITAQSSEQNGKQDLDAAIEGPGLELSFNVKYLLEMLSVINEEQILLETNGDRSAGVFKPVGRDDYTYVVMPMTASRT